ncbi:hypothetical protein AB0M95_40855 [Sphaerisporangium sp. NPDC051017]|uniref:hypothetical protein n=1 Tax=Sphaerisporangium sp. NPDC051017 TaxID=3154636 RepID=UPI003444F5D0
MPGLEEMSREELIALARALAERTVILEKENAALRERVARLERLISRNSDNSGCRLRPMTCLIESSPMPLLRPMGREA